METLLFYVNLYKFSQVTTDRVASTLEKQIAPDSLLLRSNITRTPTEYAVSQRHN